MLNNGRIQGLAAMDFLIFIRFSCGFLYLRSVPACICLISISSPLAACLVHNLAIIKSENLLTSSFIHKSEAVPWQELSRLYALQYPRGFHNSKSCKFDRLLWCQVAGNDMSGRRFAVEVLEKATSVADNK